MRRRAKRSKHFHLIRGKGDQTCDGVTETEPETYGECRARVPSASAKPGITVNLETKDPIGSKLHFIWMERLYIWTIHYYEIVRSAKGGERFLPPGVGNFGSTHSWFSVFVGRLESKLHFLGPQSK